VVNLILSCLGKTYSGEVLTARMSALFFMQHNEKTFSYSSCTVPEMGLSLTLFVGSVEQTLTCERIDEYECLLSICGNKHHEVAGAEFLNTCES
jgi:hypothetical protein